MNRDAPELTTHPSLLIRLRDLQDRQAWAMFVEVYAPLIFSYCRSRNLQDSDAADVSQEVLTAVSRALPSFEYQSERGRFRDWLGVVTHRELLQFWKRTNRIRRNQSANGQDQIEKIADTRNWESHFHAELLQLAIHRIQREFEAETWSIFQRLWIENESPNDVASSMQIKIGSVYVAKSRVLKRLRSEVLMLSDDLPLKGTTDALP